MQLPSFQTSYGTAVGKVSTKDLREEVARKREAERAVAGRVPSAPLSATPADAGART